MGSVITSIKPRNVAFGEISDSLLYFPCHEGTGSDISPRYSIITTTPTAVGSAPTWGTGLVIPSTTGAWKITNTDDLAAMLSLDTINEGCIAFGCNLNVDYPYNGGTGTGTIFDCGGDRDGGSTTKNYGGWRVAINNNQLQVGINPLNATPTTPLSRLISTGHDTILMSALIFIDRGGNGSGTMNISAYWDSVFQITSTLTASAPGVDPAWPVHIGARAPRSYLTTPTIEHVFGQASGINNAFGDIWIRRFSTDQRGNYAKIANEWKLGVRRLPMALLP